MQQQFDKHLYRYLLALAIFMLVTGTIVYHLVEKFSWLNSYYFSVITLATVGYGDYTPKTNFGKIFKTFYVLIGVGIITTFLSYNLRRRADKMHNRSQKRKDHRDNKDIS